MAGFLSELDPNKKIVPLVGLPMDRLFEKVSKLEFNSTIFYLLVFKDGNGNTYLPYDVATQISLRANAPVYSLWSALLGSGIVGGYLLSGEKVGHELGSILMNPDIVQNINAKNLNDKFGILHIIPKVLYTFGEIIPETWGYCPNKCKLENEGCQIVLKFYAFWSDIIYKFNGGEICILLSEPPSVSAHLHKNWKPNMDNWKHVF